LALERKLSACDEENVRLAEALQGELESQRCSNEALRIENRALEEGGRTMRANVETLLQAVNELKAEVAELESRRKLEVLRLSESNERAEALHEGLAREYSLLQESIQARCREADTAHAAWGREVQQREEAEAALREAQQLLERLIEDRGGARAVATPLPRTSTQSHALPLHASLPSPPRSSLPVTPQLTGSTKGGHTPDTSSLLRSLMASKGSTSPPVQVSASPRAPLIRNDDVRSMSTQQLLAAMRDTGRL